MALLLQVLSQAKWCINSNTWCLDGAGSVLFIFLQMWEIAHNIFNDVFRDTYLIDVQSLNFLRDTRTFYKLFKISIRYFFDQKVHAT